LNDRQPARAKKALCNWLAWASRSRLKPFIRLARTIRAHFDGIVAYIKNRQTNAAVEGVDGCAKARIAGEIRAMWPTRLVNKARGTIA
jgi:transposase